MAHESSQRATPRAARCSITSEMRCSRRSCSAPSWTARGPRPGSRRPSPSRSQARRRDIDDALDYLVLRGFVTESEDGLAVTEIGALTCRLMIDVESAGGLLTALAEAPVPTNADEAEELVLQILATEVRALREWPVNPKVYEDVVAGILFGWTPRITSRMGDAFGSRFCMAAAHLALRDPGDCKQATAGDLDRRVQARHRGHAAVPRLGSRLGLRRSGNVGARRRRGTCPTTRVVAPDAPS